MATISYYPGQRVITTTVTNPVYPSSVTIPSGGEFSAVKYTELLPFNVIYPGDNYPGPISNAGTTSYKNPYLFIPKPKQVK